MMMTSSSFQRSKHLNDEELMIKVQSCPYCREKSSKIEFSLQIDPEILLMTCTHCGLSYASRMPRLETLKEYYSNYYDSKVKMTTDHPNKIARYILSFIPDGANKVTSILDVGGGDGSIAIEIANQINPFDSISITIVDPNYNSNKNLNTNFNIFSFNDINELQGNDSYDLIIASAILEHIPDLSGTIDRIFSLLNSNGVLYIRTPYVVPLITLLHKLNIFIDFTYPGDLYDMGPVFWDTLIEDKKAEYSLSILASKPSSVETSFLNHPLRTFMAFICKSPWYLFSKNYPYVGGWEILIRKN